MAWDFGAGDILAGVRLATVIYDKGFVHENAADVRYKNFQNDINNFRYLLTKLNEALQNAHRRYLDRGPFTAARAHDPLSDGFESERKAIVGNFLGTLQDCDILLEQNSKYRHQQSNVIQNLSWHLAQQEQRVDDLRRRLHFHCEKIRLVLERLSIGLLTDLDAKVNDILALQEQSLHVANDTLQELNRFRATLFGYLAGRGNLDGPLSRELHAVDGRLAQKFQEYLHVDAPPNIGSGIPLIQGFDALLLHFEQSTEGSDQTPEKDLSFLKTRWLLGHLKASQSYQEARPGFYYKRAVNYIEQAISARIRQREGLNPYGQSILMNLQESCFHIWPPSTTLPSVRDSQPHPLMARANEEQVVHVELASDGAIEPDSVTIFKSSEEHFRIVLKSTLSSQPGEKILASQSVLCREDRLIPRYALPALSSPSWEVAVFSRNEETLYRFDSKEDLFRFQTALTGYGVSHDQENIRCQLSDNVGYLNCTGRIQLWQDPIILAPAVRNDQGVQAVANGAQNSPSDGSRSRGESLVPSLAPTNTVSWTDGGFEADSIKMPAIMIYTQLSDQQGRDRLATMFIKLVAGIYIDPKECICCQNYELCSKLVLKMFKKPRRFAVHTLYSDVDFRGQPNPNTFDVLPFRNPRHPLFSTIAAQHTEYLVLKFRSLAEKRRFHQELRLRFSVRDKQIEDQRDFANRIQHRQDRPRHHENSPTQSSSRIPSSSNASSFQSSPPRLAIPDSGPGFCDPFNGGAGTGSAPERRHGSNVASESTSPRLANIASPLRSTPTNQSGSDPRGDADTRETQPGTAHSPAAPRTRAVTAPESARRDMNVGSFCDAREYYGPRYDATAVAPRPQPSIPHIQRRRDRNGSADHHQQSNGRHMDMPCNLGRNGDPPLQIDLPTSRIPKGNVIKRLLKVG
ncbi:hypothetical protein LTR37_003428 [Vermiconidia calcicola]|uniref:Uncharacterized protein n=1 Tax=Vermiconidia calcicola TaxID=1690605 RepID=A0ACC3NQN1_9PEZI|nr:hypothetical protein LTR37_003428 [Vermiconidia calcicola]